MAGGSAVAKGVRRIPPGHTVRTNAILANFLSANTNLLFQGIFQPTLGHHKSAVLHNNPDGFCALDGIEKDKMRHLCRNR